MVIHSNYFSAVARRLVMPYLSSNRTSIKPDRCFNLSSGIPNPELFPFKNATFTLKTGEVLHLPQHLMDVAFQYAPGTRIPELAERLRDITTKLFAPPHMDERGLALTSGGTAGIHAILHTFLDPKDCVFLPETSYPTVFSTIKTTEAKAVTIRNDPDGLRPDMLRAALEGSISGPPKLLYVIPNGDNPTGSTLSKARRQEIYNLACEYDFLIVEDDPCYFMQYGSEVPPSFLSLDTEGRVLRIDSFSKTLGAGIRLGYVTADKHFTDKIDSLTAAIECHASVLSQVVINELLRHLDYEGFMQVTKRLLQKYQKNRDVMMEAASKHLSGLCEWNVPDGLFLWLKVLGLEDVTEMVENTCSQAGLFIVPGSSCMLHKDRPCPYIRVSYTMITPESADQAFQILSDVIKEELEKKKLG